MSSYLSNIASFLRNGGEAGQQEGAAEATEPELGKDEVSMSMRPIISSRSFLLELHATADTDPSEKTRYFE